MKRESNIVLIESSDRFQSQLEKLVVRNQQLRDTVKPLALYFQKKRKKKKKTQLSNRVDWLYTEMVMLLSQINQPIRLFHSLRRDSSKQEEQTKTGDFFARE